MQQQDPLPFDNTVRIEHVNLRAGKDVKIAAYLSEAYLLLRDRENHTQTVILEGFDWAIHTVFMIAQILGNKMKELHQITKFIQQEKLTGVQITLSLVPPPQDQQQVGYQLLQPTNPPNKPQSLFSFVKIYAQDIADYVKIKDLGPQEINKYYNQERNRDQKQRAPRKQQYREKRVQSDQPYQRQNKRIRGNNRGGGHVPKERDEINFAYDNDKGNKSNDQRGGGERRERRDGDKNQRYKEGEKVNRRGRNDRYNNQRSDRQVESDRGNVRTRGNHGSRDRGQGREKSRDRREGSESQDRNQNHPRSNQNTNDGDHQKNE